MVAVGHFHIIHANCGRGDRLLLLDVHNLHQSMQIVDSKNGSFKGVCVGRKIQLCVF